MAKSNDFKVDNYLNVAPPATRTVFEDFEQKKRGRVEFKARFSAVDPVGNMSYALREQGVEYRVVMPAAELAGANQKDARRMASLTKEYPVIVKDIDYDTRTIIVSYQLALSIAREKLLANIIKGIAEGVPVRTKARIDFIRENKAGNHFLQLNIGGVGLKGNLFKDDWSTCYTSDIRSFAKVGDVIDIEVTDVLAPKNYSIGNDITPSTKKVIFRCSRKNTISYNPWEGIEAKYPVGTTVTITCVHKDASKFFAKVDGLDELNALCVYPDNENFYIREGGRYQAFVKKVIEAEKVFILKPVREL